MHLETAAWTRRALAKIALKPGSRALDVGSSTSHYRTVEQPHIEAAVDAPLRARGVEIVHLDVKEAPGVDVVRDLDTATAAELVQALGRFELILTTSVLHYLRDPGRAADLIVELLAPGGYLVAHHPESARRSYDPVDRMWRLSPSQLEAMFEHRGLEPVLAESIRIDNRRYYRGLWSRPSWVPVRGRFWMPLPGFSERVRALVPALRWRQSCIVMRRP